MGTHDGRGPNYDCGGRRPSTAHAAAGGEAWERIAIRARDCPRISAGFLALELASKRPWIFRQEFEAEFVEATDSFFGTEIVMAAISADVEPLELKGAPLG